VLGGRRGLQAGTLGPGQRAESLARSLFPLWRRTPNLYRDAAGADGGPAGSRQYSAALYTAAGSRLCAHTPTGHYPAPEESSAYPPAARLCQRCSRVEAARRRRRACCPGRREPPGMSKSAVPAPGPLIAEYDDLLLPLPAGERGSHLLRDRHSPLGLRVHHYNHHTPPGDDGSLCCLLLTSGDQADHKALCPGSAAHALNPRLDGKRIVIVDGGPVVAGDVNTRQRD